MQSPYPAQTEWGTTPVLSQKDPASAYIRGLIGALLGALVGCIPWFIVSFFAGYFVGLLGFVVGFASFFGYKLFRGAKNFAYAMTMVVICSVLSIALSNLLDYVVQIYQVVSEDADWPLIMEETGMSMPDVILYFLKQSEILSEMVVNLAIGLVIGILGIVSARKQVSAYVLSGQVPETPAGVSAVPEQTAFVPAVPGTDASAADTPSAPSFTEAPPVASSEAAAETTPVVNAAVHAASDSASAE